MKMKISLFFLIFFVASILVGCGEDVRADMVDRSGNTYPVAIVGGQKWMAADLKSADGSTEFTVGELENACPEGWLLPSLNAWQALLSNAYQSNVNARQGLSSEFVGQGFSDQYWVKSPDAYLSLSAENLSIAQVEDYEVASGKIRCVKDDSQGLYEGSFTITAQELNVRESPSKKASVLTKYSQGTRVIVTGFAVEEEDGIIWNELLVSAEKDEPVYTYGYASSKYIAAVGYSEYSSSGSSFGSSSGEMPDWQKYLIYFLIALSIIFYIIALYKSGNGDFFIFAGPVSIALTAISFILMIAIPVFWGLNDAGPIAVFILGVVMEVGNLVWTAMVNEGVFNKILAVYAQLYTVMLVIIVLIIVAMIFALYVLVTILSSGKKEVHLGNGLYAVFTPRGDGGWTFSNFVRH